MWKALMAEGVKLRRTWIWPLVFLGPFGVISINAVRYALAYSWLVHPGSDNWGNLIKSVNSLLVPALVLGIAIVASMISGLEHRGRMWKQLRTFPLDAWLYYLSKFIWICLLLLISALLCAVGTLCLGLVLGFGASIPWVHVAQIGLYPYLAAYGLIAIQLFLSVVVPNQAYAIGAGIVSVIGSFAAGVLPGLLPFVFPSLAASPHGHGGVYILYGLVAGMMFLGVGLAVFRKTESH